MIWQFGDAKSQTCLQHGFLYLVALIDWHSRHVFDWRISNTFGLGFYLEALDKALATKQPRSSKVIQQGSQFRPAAFTERLARRWRIISV